MNTPKKKTAVELIRDWFMSKNVLEPEHILMSMDLHNLMLHFRFGNRMINEASATAEQLQMVGATREAKEVEEDIFIIRVNLNKVKKAYDLAMN